MPVGALADRHVIAQQLRDVADLPAIAPRRDELKSLADTLQGIGDGDLEPWTELDLLQAYARPESVTRVGGNEREQPYWSWLEAGIGALVFVPLLLTWFGLTKAAGAYETLIGADPKAAGRPFLQLWQTGFEGRLTGWFTFGHVAGTATGAILLLLVLALVHGIRRAAVERREDAAQRAADDLLARLVPLLTKVQLLLNEERLTSPKRFAAELSGTATTLGKLADKAVEAHKQLATAAATVGGAVESAERRLASVDTAVRPLEKTASEIGTAVASLAGPLEKVGERVEAAVSGSGIVVRDALERVRAASGDVSEALGRAGERVEDSVHTLAAAQRSFTTGTEVSADVSARLLDRLSEVAEETAKAVATSQHTMMRLDDHTRALREAAERFAELATELRAIPVAEPGTATPVSPGSPGDTGVATANVPGGHSTGRPSVRTAISMAKRTGAGDSHEPGGRGSEEGGSDGRSSGRRDSHEPGGRDDRRGADGVDGRESARGSGRRDSREPAGRDDRREAGAEEAVSLEPLSLESTRQGSPRRKAGRGQAAAAEADTAVTSADAP
ncbi:methyl-accepting chemotaxis protein [Streptomyces sp. NPDC000410]|uniref:methyl-accepting chemotaxis protein n=1 Tax=Streptomyces sp. NPDC000410 TaxID=3154254 RepID=UPI003330FD11